MIKMTAAVIHTRESWLHAAIEDLRPRFVEVGMTLPEKIHVSVGFGFGSKAESKNILGQTWATFASEDGVNHVFISPEINDTARVLATLLHELIHVADDNKHGHRGAFAEAATRLGLEGPMTATTASIELAADMITLAAELGDYPHGALSAATRIRQHEPVPVPSGGGRISSGPAKQGTRMLKVVCPVHGYTVRTTAKWLDSMGFPSCPCGEVMKLA